MYVYKIKNKKNNKVYIGQSTKSINDSKEYFGSGVLIKRAINKYGIESFTKSILCECKTKEVLNEKEIYYILKYKSNIDGYNISAGGNGGNLGDVINAKISNTVKTLWNEGYYDDVDWSKRKAHPQTKETIDKIKKAQSGKSGYWYGKVFSDEHKEKIRINTKMAFEDINIKEKFLGVMRSKKVRDKISSSLKGKEPWNKGKYNVYTDEQIKKMSESAKNRNISDEMEAQRRDKISKHFLENHPNKISILDTRTNLIYSSLKTFCDETGISWYKTKKMRKDNIIKEVSNEN